MKIPASILDRLLWPALLALLAAAGYLLITLPPMVVSQAESMAGDQPVFRMVYFGMVTAGALLLLFVWGLLVYSVITRLRKVRGRRRDPLPSKLSPAQQEREMRKQLESAARATQRAEVVPGSAGGRVRQRLEELEHKIERRKLEIVAFGAISSGKSALLNALLGEDRFATDPRGGTTLGAEEVPLAMEGQEEGRLILRDTPGLGEVLGSTRATAALEYAREADLVLFVISGALRDFEFDALRALASMEKRLLICINKEDWYTPEDFEMVVRQVREQVQRLPVPIAPEDIIAVRARPAAQKRVRILSDGTMREDEVSTPPDITALAERLRVVVERDGRHLLLANLLMRSRALAAEARTVARNKPAGLDNHDH